ncbi:hypothetical protein [Treponema pedis]|uniref:Band 7 domain-containing protein n=1 Tax=Treponema pedis str. T A4 TaxID=1291379 RepID=S5ZQA0_9SPIR|nr:hypothetical protein [Treponema pedis]AGT44827.1 hypothetical protein TPE_2353 [Treponema pedis str. T A4]QSI05467.1 hypothetical protein DYQ05_11365 [Treponema pedis]
MKKGICKFFIWLFIFGILGGTAFFFGWMQFAVPAGSYGVMLSKSGGYYNKPIMPGEFTWRWERLVPTNAEILIFNLTPLEIEYKTEGALPSSEKFSVIMEQKHDFRWAWGLTVSASVNPKSLIPLVKNANIKLQSDLDSYLKGKIEEAAQKTANEFIEYFIQNTEEYEKVKLQYGAFQTKISNELQKKLGDEIIVNTVRLSSGFVMPDLSLYAAMRSAYINYEKKQAEMLAELTTAEGKKSALQRFRMEELKNWGELLKQYPTLIDFLAVARNDAAETLKALRELQGKQEVKPQE